MKLLLSFLLSLAPVIVGHGDGTVIAATDSNNNRALQASNCTSDADCGSTQQFCGTNGTCLVYSCNNFYLYGNSSFTGNNQAESGPPLVCSVVTGTIVRPVFASVYGCDDTLTEASRPYALAFTGICTATITADTSFQCYDILNTSTFPEFVARTTNSSGYRCPSATQGSPKYSYYITRVIASYVPGNFSRFALSTGPFDTTEFSSALASTSMYSILLTGTEPTSSSLRYSLSTLTAFVGISGAIMVL